MAKRVIGFVLLGVAVVAGIVGLGSATYVPPSASLPIWLTRARIFEFQYRGELSFNDEMLCNRNVLTSTRERCKDEARLQTYPGVPAGMYFGGVAAVLLTGLGLLAFGGSQRAPAGVGGVAASGSPPAPRQPS